MEPKFANSDGEPQARVSSETRDENGATPDMSIEDSLRQLRLKRLLQQADPIVEEPFAQPETALSDAFEDSILELPENTIGPAEAAIWRYEPQDNAVLELAEALAITFNELEEPSMPSAGDASKHQERVGEVENLPHPFFEKPSAPSANDDMEHQEAAGEDYDEASFIPSPDEELRRLRLERMLQTTRFSLEAPAMEEEESEEDETSSLESQLPGEEESEDAEADQRLTWQENEEDETETETVLDEHLHLFGESLGTMGEELRGVSEEVRRMGREMFKTNRAAERNQQVFDEAIQEIRQINATIALIPTQHESAVAEARFDAKAELCRELLRLSDTLEASLAAANETIAGMQTIPAPPAAGIAFLFASARRVRESLIGSLGDSVVALEQWRDGQRLLIERLMAILQSAGVRMIESTGRTFDPALHRAVSTAVRTDVPAGTIVGEELKGYTLENRILRYAEVVVAKDE